MLVIKCFQSERSSGQSLQFLRPTHQNFNFISVFCRFGRIFCPLSITSVSPAQIAPYYFLSMPKPHLLQLLQPSLQPTSTKVLINASPTCLRQHPSLFFQDASRHVNDASAYRTAIVYSHISTCKAANVAPNMDGGYPGKEPILTAESGRTPALQPKKNK